MTRRPTTSMMATKATTLPTVIASGSARVTQSVPPSALEQAGERRQQDQHQDRRDVLDDQPADRDAAALGLDQAALLHRPQQHDGAGDREREPEHQTAAERPAQRMSQRHPEQGRDRDLSDGSRDRDRAHRQQVAEREMQADAEHQQDHPDLGELIGDVLIRDDSPA